MAKLNYQALGRLPKGEMNNTEKAYASHLELLKRAGEILDYRFEAMKFNLAKNTTYTPDFLVINQHREVELHEVKGYWTDDARVKIKVAQAQNPYFKFIAIKKQSKKDGGGWHMEDFG